MGRGHQGKGPYTQPGHRASESFLIWPQTSLFLFVSSLLWTPGVYQCWKQQGQNIWAWTWDFSFWHGWPQVWFGTSESQISKFLSFLRCLWLCVHHSSSKISKSRVVPRRWVLLVLPLFFSSFYLSKAAYGQISSSLARTATKQLLKWSRLR